MTRVLAAMALGLVVGCAGPKPGEAVADPGKVALEDLGQFLQSLGAEGKRPPAGPAELTEVEPLIPNAGPSIRNKQVVYLWGTGHVAGGSAVVAYESKAETEGGYVLLQNGSVKRMTPDELKAVPKAKK